MQSKESIGKEKIMCEFCKNHWIEEYKEYTVNDLSGRTESKYNEGFYTGIQTFIDLDINELKVVACLDNKHIKPILESESIKINYCPMCGRKLSEV